MRATRSLISLLAIAFCFTPLAHAQITNVTNDTSTPIPGAGHDYIHLLSETVNPANGSVSLRMQVPMPKGRGITIPFSFGYDSGGVHHLMPAGGPGTAFWGSNDGSLSQGGWTYALPAVSASSWSEQVPVLTGYNPGGGPIYTYYSCFYQASYLFRDPSAGVHSLGLGALWTANPPPPISCPNAGANVTGAGDSQVFATLTVNSGGVPLPPTVYDAQGTVYYFGPLALVPISTSTTYAALPSYIEDRNGNKATFATNGSATTLTDTLGRTVASISGLGPSGTTNTLTFAGQTYQATWKAISASFTVPSLRVANDGFSGCQTIPNAADTQVVISQITLPNGQFYKFYYGNDNPDSSLNNPYGLLSEIVYPTGGWVKYTWKLSDTLNEFTDYPGSVPDGAGGFRPSQDGCLYEYKTPVVATRQVGFGGSSTAALTQSFVYNTNWTTSGPGPGTTWTTKTTNVTTSGLNLPGTELAKYTYSSVPAPGVPFTYPTFPGQIPVEQTTQYYDWGNTTTPIRTVNKTWYGTVNLASQQTVLENGQSSKTVYCYTGANCVPAAFSPLHEVDEYDFGAATPTRKKVTNYQSFSGTPGFIAAEPCQSIIYDGSSNRVAETDYFYDGSTSTTPCSTATAQALPGSGSYTGHDETTYGSSSTVQRGNLTRAVSLCLQTAPACSSGNPTTTLTYDETGQVISTTDPRGNITQFSYADNYASGTGTPPGNTNAYVKTVTRPVTNGVSHISTFQYGYTDGQLRSSIDENNQTTTYQYNDTFLRPTQVNSPDSGQTTISYNDAAPSPSVTTTRKINSTQSITSLSTMDGLGHPVKSLLTSDPDCATGDRTDTTYDGFGRARTVSNPYCTTSDSTYGLTTFTYDALGRTTQVTHPDNTTILTTYTGRATQVQDEGNGAQLVTRISQSDGLGRLLSLCEVAPGPFVGAGGSSSSSLIGSSGAPVPCGQDTAGTGFLTSYQYDTLSNLLQVNQTGVAPRTFTYDSLSRLTSATNPESGAISYAYDANGNLLTKTAPAPNQTGAATVTTTYQYDALSRLTQKSYNDGSTPTVTNAYDVGCNPTYYHNQIGRLDASSIPSWSSCFGYDTMGRLADKDEYTPSGLYYLDYAYDLLGDITSESAGYGYAYYGYNTAGRLTSVTSSRSDATDPPNVFSTAHYNAFGGLTSDTLGDGEIETYTYVPKLTRLQSSTATLSSTTLYSFNITSFAPNGDILAASDTANGNWTYTYDPFNRLVGSNKNSG